MTSTGEKRRSVAIAVAPNGARRTRDEHPGVPLTPREIAYAAAGAAEAGAAMIHLHIRTPQGDHTLDPGIYREALSELRREIRNRMIVQITTDSLGIFRAPDQMAVVREVRPEAVSLALRELCPDVAAEAAFGEFLTFCRRERIAPQFILYDATDVLRYALLVEREVIPWRNAPVIFVLGRYQLASEPQPHDLLPLFEAAKPGEIFSTFMTCAFSPAEAACGIAGALLGGDIRVGFENNIVLPDGRLAPDNAALVRAVVEPLAGLARVPEDVDAMRERYLV